MHLVVGLDGVLQVRGPWRCSRSEAQDLVAKHADWVLETLDRHQSTRRKPLVTGTELNLLDCTLRLRIEVNAQLSLLDSALPASVPARQGSSRVPQTDGEVIRDGECLRVRSGALSPGNVRALLEVWYRQQAKRLLPARLHHFSRQLGMTPRKVAIRSQRTRWGSCSSRGTISLNWRLLLLPTQLSNYVLVHELCHLRHLNHSPAYWRLVGSIMPDYQELDQGLSDYQRSLPL